MSEKQAVVVAGYYGFGNLGDEAIRDALVGELTRSESSFLLPRNCQRQRRMRHPGSFFRLRILALLQGKN